MSNLDPLEIVNRPSTVKEQNTGMLTQPTPKIGMGMDLGIAPIAAESLAGGFNSDSVKDTNYDTLAEYLPDTYKPSGLSGIVGDDFSLSPDKTDQTNSGFLNAYNTVAGTDINDSYLDAKSNLYSQLEIQPAFEGAFTEFSGTAVPVEGIETIEQVNSFLSDNKEQLQNTLKVTQELGEYYQDPEGEAGRGVGEVADRKNQKEVLNAYGLPDQFNIAGTYGGFSGYTYDSDTNSYVKTFDDEKSFIEGNAYEFVKLAINTVATAGIGNALSASSAIANISGGSAAIANAVGQGAAAGLVSAAQGGDFEDIVQNAALGGLDGYADGLAIISDSANAAAGVIGATAEAANHAAALASQLDVVNTIKTSIKLAEAIDQKDLLGVVNSGLDLAGMDSLQTYAEGTILSAAPDSEFLIKHADELAAAAIKVTDKLVSGDSLDEAVKSGLTTYVREGGGLGGLLPDIDLGDGLDIDVLPDGFVDWIKTTASDINRDVIRPVVDTVVNTTDEVVRALPTTKQDWEDAEQGIKDVASDTAGVVREVGRDVREFVDPLANDVRQVGRDIRNIDLPNVDLPGFDLPSFNMDLGTGPGQRMASLGNSLLSDEGVTLTDYETLDNNLLQQLRI